MYYDYFSPHVIGFRTGVTVDMHNASLGKTNYDDTYSTIDVENEQMDISYSIRDLQERYTMYSVGVPLQIAVSTHGFHLFAGAKAVFPLANSWKETVRHAALAVYYPKYDNIVEESFPLAASRDFEMTQTGKLTLPTVQWWGAIEAGYAIPIRSWNKAYRTYIMVGAYLDYCFSPYKASQSEAESLIMLSDTREGFPLQRLLTPVMEANRQGRKLVKEVALFDAGIKVSFAISPYDRASRRRAYRCQCLPFSR